MNSEFYTLEESSLKLGLTIRELKLFVHYLKTNSGVNSLCVEVTDDKISGETVDKLLSSTTHIPRTVSHYKITAMLGSEAPKYCDEYHAAVALRINPNQVDRLGKEGFLQVRRFKSELGISRLYFLDEINTAVSQAPVNGNPTYESVKRTVL